MSDYLLQEDGFQILLEDDTGSIILEVGTEALKIDQLAIVQPSHWLASPERR